MSSTSFFISSFLISVFLLSISVPLVLGVEDQRTTSVSINSLIASNTCSNPEGSQGNSLPLSHPYGPCSPLGGNTTANPDLHDLVRWNELRRLYIHKRYWMETASEGRKMQITSTSVNLPTESAIKHGFIGFLIKIGLGTPKVEQTVIVDTGSDLSWIRCEPCLSTCPNQLEPRFVPLNSTTFQPISCASGTPCDELNNKTCTFFGLCRYRYGYGNDELTYTYSDGYLGRETLTLTSTDIFPNFVFGCDDKSDTNTKIVSVAGLFGFGRGKLSIVTQTSARYGNVFSYCIPESFSSNGRLTFGPPETNGSNIMYTPLLSSPQVPTFYFLNMTGISVGGNMLNVDPVVFRHTILDSGSSLTTLPAQAYAAFRTAFGSYMTNYTPGQPLESMDTCYDLTGLEHIKIPLVEFHFTDLTIQLGVNQIFVALRRSQVCLAFSSAPEQHPLGIIGYVQQRGLEIVHDLAMHRIGFLRGTC